MLLGESCYGEDENEYEKEDVKNLIKNVQTEEWKLNFFTKMNNFLSETTFFSDFNFNEFLDSIIYHEYIQDVLPGPRIRPTKEQWEYAETIFFKQLKKYKPDLILCFGNQMYQKLPPLDGEIDNLFKSIHNGKTYTGEVWKYTIDEHEIKILNIQHLSSSISYKPWRKIVDKFMNTYC